MKETSADRYEQVEKLKVPYTLQVWHKLSDKDDSLFDGEEPEEYLSLIHISEPTRLGKI